SAGENVEPELVEPKFQENHCIIPWNQPQSTYRAEWMRQSERRLIVITVTINVNCHSNYDPMMPSAFVVCLIERFCIWKIFLKFDTSYSTNQESLIVQEFCRVKGKCYLDHAGATLYSEKQLENTLWDLSNNVYSNPHAKSVTSKSTEDAIDIVRYQILNHFNTNNEEYTVIFTSSATAALKTIAECFNYGKTGGTLLYLENNHTSVLGMRNYAKCALEIKTEHALQILSSPSKNERSFSEGNNTSNLFVYPAQCNFSGTKYPLTWIHKVKDGWLNDLVKNRTKNWFVTLDCASYVSTNVLDLSKYKPDFIPISFYKMFGYPTGLGAQEMLVKKYFGGGTVLMALSSKNVMIPRKIMQDRFEDGTLPFLSILAIKHGFDTINRLNLSFDIISQHTYSLAQYFYRNLLVLHHFNGNPIAILYHDTVFENRQHQGGIVNFNLLRPNGDFIGFAEVLHMTNLHGIQIRTGCFCNPGACQRFLQLSENDVIKHFEAGHVCGDQNDLVDNYPTGSVRISFGYMSTREDADKLLKMIENCFVSKPIIKKLPTTWCVMQKKYEELFLKNHETTNTTNNKENVASQTSITERVLKEHRITNGNGETPTGSLKHIFVYPIKSCGAFSVKDNWTITPKGLQYDREWMITTPTGVCLTQKHNRNLCLIKPEIDLKRNILILKFKGKADFKLSLVNTMIEEQTAYICQSKVCGDRIQGWDCGDKVSDWLSENLCIPGLRLLRQCNFDEEIMGRISKNGMLTNTTSQLSLANKAQYLLVNSKSVEWLMGKIPNGELTEDAYSITKRFRPNFVVDFTHPFQENNYNSFSLSNISFKFAGRCTRCQMICINQESGDTSKEPLLTLSREFKGKINFGVYLNQEGVNEERSISLGCDVTGTNYEG
ncbi:hypothetical protein NQ315_012100, partial [Exocentrus adspersus]